MLAVRPTGVSEVHILSVVVSVRNPVVTSPLLLVVPLVLVAPWCRVRVLLRVLAPRLVLRGLLMLIHIRESLVTIVVRRSVLVVVALTVSRVVRGVVVIPIVAPSTTVIPSVVVATSWLEVCSSRKVFSDVLETLRLAVLFVPAVFFRVLSGTHSTVDLPFTIRGRLTKNLASELVLILY